MSVRALCPLEGEQGEFVRLKERGRRRQDERGKQRARQLFLLTTDTDNPPSFTSRWVLLVILVTRGQPPELDPRTTRRRELTKRDDSPPTPVLDLSESTLFGFEVVTSSSVLFVLRGEWCSERRGRGGIWERVWESYVPDGDGDYPQAKGEVRG